MKVSKHTIYQKLGASLFFVLLFFIYGEKAFHIHELPAKKTQKAGVTSLISSPVCSICDFTVAKDSELPDLVTPYVPFTFLLKQYILEASSYYYLPDNFISGRGPPLS